MRPGWGQHRAPMFMAEVMIRPDAPNTLRVASALSKPAPQVPPAKLNEGLSEEEAHQLLAYFGPNDIPSDKEHGLLAIILDVMKEPMFLLLVAAAAIYATLGEKAESLLVACFAGLTIFLVIIQQNRSEKAIQALQMLAAPTARVMRDGREQQIAARVLVPGDILLIGEGERIAADALLKEGYGLQVDESILTGEAVPVRKLPESMAKDIDTRTPGGDDQPHLYSGTLVVSGYGIAEVQFTAGATKTGDIGKSLADIKSDDTIVQKSVTRVVKIFGVLAFIVSSVLVLFYGLTRGDWLQGALSGVALAMAMLSEEFPVVLAIFLALGALRLSRIGVLARRSSAIEALGAATILCVDKTGTLTKNEMRLRCVTGQGQLSDMISSAALSDGTRATLKAAKLASRSRSVDPLDSAVHACASLINDDDQGELELIREFGLTPQLLAMTSVWRKATAQYFIASKGAPETIMALCRLEQSERSMIEKEVISLAQKGWRVLAVATAAHDGGNLPEDPRAFAFRYQGLIAFEDPLRDSVPAAVREAKAAGIAVAMITGDYPVTASAIAREAGIDGEISVLTGPEISDMNDEALRGAVQKTRTFARVQPTQKLRIVAAFSANGEIVAMTGDGVNDAPALKAAHIGIAIGPRGTDVAREASDLVLMREDFSLIVSSIRLGRRIFDNLRKVMIYITAVHVPIAGLALLPVLFGFPPVMLPVHVVLTEMIIDPICSLAFENEADEPNIMSRPPRNAADPIVGVSQIMLGFLQGSLLLIATLSVYWLSLQNNSNDGVARALAFIALTAGNLTLVCVNGAQGLTITRLFARGHLSFWIIACLGILTIWAAITFPILRDLLKFDVPTTTHVGLAAMVGVVSVLLFDLLKLMPTVQRTLGAAST
jgi:P-type Ca2+ transporter type 2C